MEEFRKFFRNLVKRQHISLKQYRQNLLQSSWLCFDEEILLVEAWLELWGVMRAMAPNFSLTPKKILLDVR